LSLGKKTLRSTGWTTAGMLINQTLNFGRLALLVRLLSPEDFGLYAMALVFFMFVQTFANMGTASALIQKKEHTATLASTVFYTNLVFGVLLTAIVYALSPLIASTYNEPSVQGLLQLLSAVFIISAFGVVHSALLRRELNFDGVVKAEIIANIISTIVCIYLALNGFKAYSFVYQMLVMTAVNACLLWYYCRWRPQFVFSIADVKSVFTFSANLTLFGFVDYIAMNIDKFLVGKFMGTAALGSYYLGYRVILMPIKQITNSVKHVLFSALSKLQDDNVKFRQVFLKVVYIIAFFTIPLMLTLIPVADLLTDVLFGEKWGSAVAVLRIFAPLGLVLSIVTPVTIVYLAKDQTGMLLKYGLLSVVLLTTGVALGMLGNVSTVALGFVTAYILLLIPIAHSGLGFIDLTLRDLLSEVLPIFLKAGLVALLAWGGKFWLQSSTQLSPAVILACVLAFAISSYLVLSVKSVLREYRYLKQFV